MVDRTSGGWHLTRGTPGGVPRWVSEPPGGAQVGRLERLLSAVGRGGSRVQLIRVAARGPDTKPGSAQRLDGRPPSALTVLAPSGALF